MRPLVLEYPEDLNTYHLSDQFLLGQDLLIAPICEPGKQHRIVYLPEGIWYDYWNGTRYEGGSHIIAHAPLDILPMYVRGGAIIPLTRPVQHTGEGNWSDLDIHLYAQGGLDQAGTRGEAEHRSDIRGSFSLYEDDGRSDQYLQGAYNIIQLQTEESKGLFTIKAAYKVCGLGPDDKSIRYTVHHLSFVPRTVSRISKVHDMNQLEEQSSGWYYDKQDNQLYIKTTLAGLQEVELIVRG